MRFPRHLSLVCGLLAELILLGAAPTDATIRYRVSLLHPGNHLFHVAIEVPAGRGEHEIVAAIPAWNALYQTRDFAYRVQDVVAALAPHDPPWPPLPQQKLDKQTWRFVLPSGSPSADFPDHLLILYDVYWDEAGPFSSQLSSHHAFMNLAEILMYLPDRRSEDVTFSLADIPTGWKTAVELPFSNGSYRAENYDKLVDAPIEVGAFKESSFTEQRTRYRVVVDGPLAHAEHFQDSLQKIVAYEAHLMGGAPFPEYMFIFHFGPYQEARGGGMEHANSTAIAVQSEEYAPSVAAHEFFHAWNVKRIRPQSLEPVDYSREQWTRALWFAEGVTSTYGEFTLLRTGITEEKQFLADFAEEIRELDSRPARQWQSVEESSLDAWLEKYDLYRRQEESISYYNKGEILGFLLDIVIRNATNNHKSLDDVMRALNERFAKQGRFYRDSADIEGVAEEISGVSLSEFFHKYVSGTDEVPYQDFLTLVGLRLEMQTQEAASLGFTIGRAPGAGAAIADIEEQSAAYQAGLRVGDGLVSLNDEPFPRSPARWLRSHKPGETVRVRFRREGQEKELTFALLGLAQKEVRITHASDATERQRRIREGFLRGTND